MNNYKNCAEEVIFDELIYTKNVWGHCEDKLILMS